MPKMTLLEIVQDVLNDLSSDNVNSISDTVESYQIATTAKSVYYNIITNSVIPEHRELDQLTGLGNTDKPNYMGIPSDVELISWVKYDKRTTSDITINYQPIDFYPPDLFVERILSRDSSATNVDTITDDSGIKLLIHNDKHPEFYTSFDDDYLVFDSYNSNEESTLTSDRSLIYVKKEPSFTLENDFVPDLDASLFPLYLNEVKSTVFVNNEQAANPIIERASKRQWTKLQDSRYKIKKQNNNNWVDYGRK